MLDETQLFFFLHSLVHSIKRSKGNPLRNLLTYPLISSLLDSRKQCIPSHGSKIIF